MTASRREDVATVVPRILVVSRRSIRKNKFIDFVGEYHLDLLVQYGACPIIVPRVENISKILDTFEPIHGVLLAEGEDISVNFRGTDLSMQDDVLDAIKNAHPSDAQPDLEKDCIEFDLVNRCLQRGIPYFGICRGSQILNLVAGGTLLQDIEVQLSNACKHIDYENYDDHRHEISLVDNTPMKEWFDGANQLQVNSYHHQGIQQLAHRFVPMAHSPDGLIEAFYDPEMFCPEQGKFFVGLQFHPERMQDTQRALLGEKATFDYPGCPRPYEAFVKAATAFRKRQEPPPVRLSIRTIGTMERQASLSSFADEVSVDKENIRRGQNRFKTLLTMRGRLEAGAYNLSKEDQRRLCRYGASVHGNRMAYKLLNDKTNLRNENVSQGNSCSRYLDTDWDCFETGIGQAESHLRNLTGDRLSDAIALIRKLAQSLSL